MTVTTGTYAPGEVPEHLRVTPIDVSPATIVEWIKPEPCSALEERCLGLLAPGEYEIYHEKIVNYLADLSVGTLGPSGTS